MGHLSSPFLTLILRGNPLGWNEFAFYPFKEELMLVPKDLRHCGQKFLSRGAPLSGFLHDDTIIHVMREHARVFRYMVRKIVI